MMMKNKKTYLPYLGLFILSVTIFVCEIPATKAHGLFFPVKAGWWQNKMWDDGLVEKAVYSAQKVVYGKVREFDAIFLTNVEKADPEKLVKISDWNDPKAIPVIKFNQVMELATEFYDYRYMVHTYSDRRNLKPLKMLVTSQEWCGTTFKEFLFAGEKASLKSFSYQAGDGDVTYDLGKFEKGLLFDQLPVAFRALAFQADMKFYMPLLSSQITNKGGSNKIIPAFVSYIGEEDVNTPMGEIASYKISMRLEKDTTLFWFEKEYPNIMVKRINPDGTAYLLKSRSRIKYWR